jgi:hypothetical protein
VSSGGEVRLLNSRELLLSKECRLLESAEGICNIDIESIAPFYNRKFLCLHLSIISSANSSRSCLCPLEDQLPSLASSGSLNPEAEHSTGQSPDADKE